MEGGHSQCSVNPQTGFEHILPVQPIPAANVKKIAVIGAGPAEIMCAVTAAQGGHNVTLYEKNPQIGMMLVPGSMPKIIVNGGRPSMPAIPGINREKVFLTLDIFMDPGLLAGKSQMRW